MAQAKPNVIYILADDMGYGDISYLNERSQLHTPHLDRLGRQGIAFTDAHSSSAVCTPSRYSIMTGRYNWRSALKSGVLRGYSKPLIEDGRLTVGSLLQSQGYRTACIGKWHLGLEWTLRSGNPEDIDYAAPIANGPLQNGFDYFFGIAASLDMPPYVYIENDRVTAQPDRVTVAPKSEHPMGWWREGPTGADFRHEDVLPRLTAKTLERIDAYAGEPFFLYVPLNAPHTPVLPSPAFRGRSGLNDYGDFVLMIDDMVGQVMRKLEEQGIEGDTILVFTSDNGCSPEANFAELASFGHNPSYVFRGHKADIYEGGHRIPLLVQWPERIRAGTISGEPVCLVDLLATMADMLQVPLPKDAGEDSVSNLGVWLGEYGSPLREAIVHHSVNGSLSIRRGDWKLELCPGSGGWSDPKPGEEPEGTQPIQLYNLAADIGERRNVAAEHPAIVRQLEQLLEKYVASGRSVPCADG